MLPGFCCEPLSDINCKFSELIAFAAASAMSAMIRADVAVFERTSSIKQRKQAFSLLKAGVEGDAKNPLIPQALACVAAFYLFGFDAVIIDKAKVCLPIAL